MLIANSCCCKMPQAWRLKDYEASAPSSHEVSLSSILDSHSQHRDWQWTHSSQPFSPTAAQTKLFYPRSYSASTSLNSLNTPWFVDYGHLTFWFFFFTTFILAMWLITLHNLAAKNVESRWPRRETRGFSRAQAGDAMTAVLPLTWSITMLLHASTHSLNFDENTSATSFSFTVIAYQWGWNYYFPRDIVEKLAGSPRIVGRGHIDTNASATNYSYLLERARSEYLARLLARGDFADIHGRDTVANVLSLFTRPGGASAAVLDGYVVSGLWSPQSSNLTSLRAAWRAHAEARANRALSCVQTREALLDQFTSPQSWASSGIGEGRMLAELGASSKTPTYNLGLARAPFPHTPATPSWLIRPRITTNTQHPYVTSVFSYTTQPVSHRGNTMRTSQSFFLVGNRLGLIHKHLSSSKALSPHLNERALAAAFLRRMGRYQQGFGPLSSALPSWAKESAARAPVHPSNIMPNLWLVTGLASPSRAWTAELGRGGSVLQGINTQLNTHLKSGKAALPRLANTLPIIYPNSKVSCITNRLSRLASPQNLFLSKGGQFAASRFLQAQTYSGSPHSLGFLSNKTLNFEDMGLINSSSVKQLQLRLAGSSTRATHQMLLAAAAPRPNMLMPIASQNIVLLHHGDRSSRLLQAHTSIANYSAVALVPALMPTKSPAYTHMWPMRVSALTTSSVAAATSVWALSALPVPEKFQDYTALARSMNNRPSTRLGLGLSLRALSKPAAWYSSSFSAQMGGSAQARYGLSSVFEPTTFRAQTVQQTHLVARPTRPMWLWSKPTTSFAALTVTEKLTELSTNNLTLSPSQIAVIMTISAYAAHEPIAAKLLAPISTLANLPERALAYSLPSHPIQLGRPMQACNLEFRPASSGLQGLRAVYKGVSRPPFFSSWLEGATPQRPVRSSMDKTGDPINFTGKSDLIGGQRYFSNQLMFSWYWQWASQTTNFSLPLAKLYRGAAVRRGVGGFWSSHWANDVISQAALMPETVIDLNKQAWPTLISGVSKLKSKTVYPELSPAVLDNEWTRLATVPVCLTPDPYEDLDQPFIHQKWAIEVNTTRRGDHASKHKLTWGPLAALKAGKVNTFSRDSAHSVYGAVGPINAAVLPTRFAQNIALLNECVLSHKTSTGLLLAMPLSTLGELTLSPVFGPRLLQPLTPRLNATTNAAVLLQLLRFRPAFNAFVKAPQAHAHTQSAWLRLWKFRSNISDLQLAATAVHASAYPTYWTTRALLILGIREELAVHSQCAGVSTPLLPDSLVVGAQHPLLRDVELVYGLAPTQAKWRGLSAQAWEHSSTHLGVKELNKSIMTMLDRSVEAHLLARAGHSLVNDEIGSIRRLRVTKGIYLPSDIPMHVICASKDVIHSWALPGLNIKIDCIPGYNSHRRLLMRWRGAYWGQCMEVCGRYHHWMPILINVVHKDIFLGWCMSYLRLIEARSQSSSRAMTMLATVDVLSLEAALTLMLKQQTRGLTSQALEASALVTYELEA